MACKTTTYTYTHNIEKTMNLLLTLGGWGGLCSVYFWAKFCQISTQKKIHGTNAQICKILNFFFPNHQMFMIGFNK